jgi:hypothetical protein
MHYVHSIKYRYYLDGIFIIQSLGSALFQMYKVEIFQT